MTTGKVLTTANHISSRDPTISAVYLVGEKCLALSASYVSYYLSRNDDYSFRDERAVFGIALGGRRFSTKIAFEYFRFLNVYSEKELYSSFGYFFRKRLKSSLNLLYKNRGLLVGDYENENKLSLSTSLLFDLKKIRFLLEPGGATLFFEKKTFSFNHCYINISANTLGGGVFNQGVRIKFLFNDLGSARLFWAVSFIGMKKVNLNLNIATNPMLFGCGISFILNKNTLYFGSSTHPVLGTSLSVGMEHLFRRR